MSLDRAKRLRQRMTDAEHRLWYRLRAHRFDGHKFKRQVPIGPYVVDFGCLNRRLIIELDGGQHADRPSDRRRDAWLKMQGYEVLRFWNIDVLKNTEAVLEAIVMALETDPSPARCARRSLPKGARGKMERT